MDTATLLRAVAGALAGGLLGAVFFRSLAGTARLYLTGGVRGAVALHLLRLGGAAAVFTLTALFAGAAALLGLLAGFQAARMAVLRRERRAP